MADQRTMPPKAPKRLTGLLVKVLSGVVALLLIGFKAHGALMLVHLCRSTGFLHGCGFGG